MATLHIIDYMKKSFTLIELIVVIAIIAILAAIIAPNAFRAIEKAKISAVVSDMKTIKKTANAYYADTGQFPWNGAVQGSRNEDGIGFLYDDGTFGWDGPYIEKWPKTPWTQEDMRFFYYYWLADWDQDGVAESHFITIRKYTVNPLDPASDSTALSTNVMQKIDNILDDGNLTTGKVRFLNNRYFDYCVK